MTSKTWLLTLALLCMGATCSMFVALLWARDVTGWRLAVGMACLFCTYGCGTAYGIAIGRSISAQRTEDA